MRACASAEAARPSWSDLVDAELYDHRGDPSTSFSATENVNLAHQPDHAKVRKALHAQLVASWAPSASGECDVVRDFGAVGDNKTEDTAAVSAALAACSWVHFPAGHTFLLRPIELRSHTILTIEGTIVAWPEIETWPNSTRKLCTTTPYQTPTPQIKYAPQRESLLFGYNLTNVTIQGGGTIDGQGWRWWPLRNDTRHGDYWHDCRPKLLMIGTFDLSPRPDELNTDIHVSGITLKNSPFWTFTARHVRGLVIRRVQIYTSGCGYNEAPNTDGFNLQGENILIEHSRVRNGDDCVPLFPPTRNVTVRNLTCECGNGPAVCIWPKFSIQGDGGDIADVLFDGVVLHRTNNAVSVKSLPTFTGRARNVSFIDMRLDGVRTGVAVNFRGQGGGGGGGGEGGGGGLLSAAIRRRTSASTSRARASVAGLVIRDVRGTVTTAAGHFYCAEGEPCTGVVMRNVTLLPAGGGGGPPSVSPYVCEHAQGSARGCSPAPCGWS